MKKLLVLQLGGAADVLLTTPLLRGLKKAVPGIELHCLVHFAHAEVLSGNPYIDHLHLLQFSIQTAAHELLPQAFDGVLNLHPNAQANEILQEINAPLITDSQKGFKAFFKNLFAHKGTAHPADRYLQMGAPLGVQNDGLGLDYFVPRSAEVPYADIPAAHSAGFIAIAVGTDIAQTAWPLFLQQLLTRVEHPVILIGTEEERPVAQKLAATDSIKIYNACGKFNRHETADLLRKSRLLVTAHPYYTQLAAALHKPAVPVLKKQDAPPYYGERFLKSKKSPVFKTVPLSIVLQPVSKGKTEEGTVQMQQGVQTIFNSMTHLLRTRD